MDIVTVDKNNIDSEHICCAIGNDAQNKARSSIKKAWLKERFKDGLIFKKLNERGKVFIEYIPIEKGFKPIIGKKYMLINCLWVSGKFKGQGYAKELLSECIKDAMVAQMNGIAVVTSSKIKPFLTDKKFYVKHGFEVIDKAPPYFELLALKLNDKAELPKFTQEVKSGYCSEREGAFITYSNHCPFMKEYVGLFGKAVRDRGIKHKILELSDAAEAQRLGSPFGTFGFYYDGKFITHELMSLVKFEKLLDGLTKS